jgi:hypothetical protein
MPAEDGLDGVLARTMAATGRRHPRWEYELSDLLRLQEKDALLAQLMQGAAGLVCAGACGIVFATALSKARQAWTDWHQTFTAYWARDFSWYEKSRWWLGEGDGYRQQVEAGFPSFQAHQQAASYGFAAAALIAAACGGYHLWRMFSAGASRRQLEGAWLRRFARGFMLVLFDEQVAAMLQQLHREKLPGVAELKPPPQNLSQRLRLAAVHAEALARNHGHVESLRRGDLRLVQPFGAAPAWGVLLCGAALWMLWATWLICGRIAAERQPDYLFALGALLLQIGPLAALEFARLSTRVTTVLIALLQTLLE